MTHTHSSRRLLAPLLYAYLSIVEGVSETHGLLPHGQGNAGPFQNVYDEYFKNSGELLLPGTWYQVQFRDTGNILLLELFAASSCQKS